jgi:hypothetical protein
MTLPGSGRNEPKHDPAFNWSFAKSGKAWKSYQEDIDLTTASGQLINLPLPENQCTVPLVSISGVFGAGNVNLNAYNASNQYNYAAKHNPQVFFTDTQRRRQYKHLESVIETICTSSAAIGVRSGPRPRGRLQLEYSRPIQRNAQRTKRGFAGLTGDAANIRLGDNAMSRLVPSSCPQKLTRTAG